MSQKQKPDLAAALADVSGSRRSTQSRASHLTVTREKTAKEEGREVEAAARPQASRNGTAPITGHFPKQVRDELKILAVERGSTLANLMAEAFNDLFAKYGKPEIAPHSVESR